MAVPFEMPGLLFRADLSIDLSAAEDISIILLFVPLINNILLLLPN